MFTMEETNGREVITFGKGEAITIMDEINTSEDGNIITLGSPQLGINELNFLANLLKGKNFTKRCMIFCPRAIYNQAEKSGLIGKIERAGGEFICDSCTCLTPLITSKEVDSVLQIVLAGIPLTWL